MTNLDLRSGQRDARREPIFETLDDANPGEEVVLLADDAVDVLLHRYRVERSHDLRWQTERRDGELAIRVTKGDSFDESEQPELDVRELPPQRRHELLTTAFDRLDPGEGFVFVNDHDPKPLYHELRSTRGDSLDWEYASRGPEAWRVEVVKTGAAESTAEDVAASFDVREIPEAERHSTIHHRYGNIGAGETMELIASHVPRPLHHEFRERYGDSFVWDVVEDDPDRCRVRITKQATTDVSESSEASDSAGDTPVVTKELDVRDLPPAKRHERIFDAYASLGMGEGFVLVNDHDPKPLYHQFDAEAGDAFYWEYRRRNPGEFRVLIGKRADAESTPAEGPSDAV